MYMASLWDKMSKSSQGLKCYIFLWQGDGNVRWLFFWFVIHFNLKKILDVWQGARPVSGGIGHNILQQNKRLGSIQKKVRFIPSHYTDITPWELTNGYSLSFLVIIIIVVVVINISFIINVIVNVTSLLRKT